MTFGRIAREARDGPAEQRDGAIPASGIRRVRSSPATCRTERERSPEQPGPKGNAHIPLLKSPPKQKVILVKGLRLHSRRSKLGDLVPHLLVRGSA